MATTAAGTPYVESTDLASSYPAVSLGLANRVDQVMQAPTQNAITSTGYTAVLLDAGKTVTRSNAAASTHTIPAQATLAWAANTQLNILNIGAGTVTITPAATVTINGTPLTLTTSQGGSLVRTASNTWTFIPIGGLTTGLVVPYANASARTAAIPSPVEGDMSSLANDDKVYRYNGTLWVAVAGADTTASGYTVLATGLIMQYGQTGNVASLTNQTVTFPIAFNSFGAVTVTVSAGSAFTSKGTSLNSWSNINFAWSHNVGATTNANWIAVGR